MVSIDHNHIVDHNKLIQKTGRYLFNAIKYSFDRARAGREPEKFSNDPFNIERKYSGIERSMLQNFLVESFTVSGVLNYDLQEKLKELAVKIMNDPAFQTSVSGKTVDPNKEFIRLAQGMIAKYNYTGETPPEGHLQTNLRTAINSAWNASNWNKINESGIYPALQYKTMADNRVREEHAKLHDRVWLTDDPVWDSIYPPNSHNCRCRIKPITHDELGQHYVEPTTDQMRADIKVEAGISKEFDRNSGKVQSIWQKWLDAKMEKTNWSEVFKRSWEYDRSVEKMISKTDFVNIVSSASTKYRDLEFTEENWKSDLPGNKVKTKLGDAELKDVNVEGVKISQFNKMLKKGRSSSFGLLKPTLQEPIMVIRNKRGAIIFIKSFHRGEKSIIYNAVTYDKGDLIEIVSSYQRGRIIEILKEIKSGEILLFEALTSKTSGSFSRGISPVRPETFDLNTNITPAKTNFNEVWGRRYYSPDLKRYRSVLSYITYRVDGFELTKSIDGVREIPALISYAELDKHRQGVMIYE